MTKIICIITNSKKNMIASHYHLQSVSAALSFLCVTTHFLSTFWVSNNNENSKATFASRFSVEVLKIE